MREIRDEELDNADSGEGARREIGAQSDKSQIDELTEGLDVGWSSGGRGGGGGRRRRSDYATRDLTQGSVAKNLWFLAWPQVIEGALNVIDQFADLFWAGRGFGFRAIGAIGAAQSYTRLVMTGRMGLDMGMQAMISRAVGQGNITLANHVALQGFTLTTTFAVLMVFAGVLLTEPLLRIVGMSDEMVDIGATYMQIQFIGSATMAFRMMSGAALQASGDALTPMKATALSRFIHLPVAPIMAFGGIPILGWNWFAEMGISGLALANVGAQIFGVGWNFCALFTGTSKLHLTLKGYRVDFRLLFRMLRIGIPASVTGMERAIAELVVLGFVTVFGDASVAAYALTRRLEMFTNLGSMGLGRGSGVLVGQNLGAGRPDRARQTVLWALVYVTVIRGTMGLLLIAFPTFFIALINQDPELLAVAVLWVQIQAVGGLVMGAGMVFMQSFNVAGDTITPMIVTLVSMWGVEVPFAYVLSRYTAMGQYGIPVAVAAAMFTRVFLYIPYFFRGNWMNVTVFDEDRSHKPDKKNINR